MAAAIPEAVEAASSAGEAAAGREIRPSRIPARNRPPFGPEPEGPRRSGGRDRAPVALGTRQDRSRGGGQPRGGQRRERQFSQQAKKTGRGALRARLPGSHSYQPVILAEFVVAVVVVSVSPLAGGGTQESKAKGSASPYSVNTLKQLVAIGAVYFVLALLASSRRAGRFAAWFGALVLVGLGLLEYANGDLTALFSIFGPSATSGASQPAQSGIVQPGPPITSGIDAGIPGAGQGIVQSTQSVTFSQPGVATTTESSPGVTVT